MHESIVHGDNEGKTMPFLSPILGMVKTTTYLWWFGGWFMKLFNPHYWVYKTEKLTIWKQETHPNR